MFEWFDLGTDKAESLETLDTFHPSSNEQQNLKESAPVKGVLRAVGTKP